MSEPRVIVCAGGGGVGKTTTAAALGVAFARAGSRTLIVTIDPARRLAGAMGVAISDTVTPVPLAVTEGRLSALMPDPRRSMHTFIDHLFEEQPEARARLLSNRLFQGLADAAAGIHELVAMNLVAHASNSGQFDIIVIDTAPSRHAIDFVTYPGRLATMLSSRTVEWLAGFADGAAETQTTRPSGVLSWGTSRVEAALARVTGPQLLRDTTSLFTELARVRERFVRLTQRASTLLLGERVVYALVAAPTAAARDDVLYLARRLAKLNLAPGVLLLNRADTDTPAYIRSLRSASGVAASIVRALDVLDDERTTRAAAAATLQRELSLTLKGVSILRLPHVEASAPEAIVLALSESLAPHLRTILPRV